MRLLAILAPYTEPSLEVLRLAVLFDVGISHIFVAQTEFEGGFHAYLLKCQLSCTLWIFQAGMSSVAKNTFQTLGVALWGILEMRLA